MAMSKKADYHDLSLEAAQQLLFSRDEQIKQRQKQRQANEKELAELAARWAYLQDSTKK